MGKYQIWDKQSTIYTLVGEVLDPEEWLLRYPWANIEGVKMIIGSGVINGTVAMEFGAAIETYAKMGADFSACRSDQDYLDVIEAFENASSAPSNELSTEERTAAALEFIAMSSLPDKTV